MNIAEKIKSLAAWLADGDCLSVNDDHTMYQLHLVNEGTLSFYGEDSGYGAIDLTVDNVDLIEWSNYATDYGIGHYCHVVMKDGQGYEIRSYNKTQRQAPEEIYE